MVNILKVLFVLLGASEAAERVLHGSHHDLPASAPENKELLRMKQTEIRDTTKRIGDAMEQNFDVHELLYRITAMPYFSTYKVDLSDSRCPLEDDTATCSNRQCAIEPLSDGDIDPNLFQQQYLGRLRKNSVLSAPPDVSDENCAPESRSIYAFNDGRDYCYPEDESEDSAGVWIDLSGNAERFTGYEGPHARLMWAKVYEENCFGYHGENEEDDINNDLHKKQANGASGDSSIFDKASNDLAAVMMHPSDSTKGIELPTEECVEQRLFYRLLSGMQASISTHLTYDWYNATSNKWQENLPEWLERVGWHSDRLNNLFFDYALVSRAVSKLVNAYEQQLLFSSTCESVDIEVRSALRRLGKFLRRSPLNGAIDERQLFSSPQAASLKSEFRQRVRNVNALMSCVGCERCRLWGKIQTAGYGTALKILFELPRFPDEDIESTSEVLSTFRRSELVALINTFARLSHSVYAIEEYFEAAEEQLIDKYSFSYNWNKEMNTAWIGIKFILKSYIDFPKNAFRWAIYYMNIWWNRLALGIPEVTDISDLQDHYEL